MVYPNLKFPKIKNRPFFYTNFVQTIDGKTWVSKKGYWPIGSKKDYQTLLELRAYADCLIHGKNVALEFGTQTLESINQDSFKKMRQKLGKNPNLPYYIVTNHPKSLDHLNQAQIVGSDLKKLVQDLQSKDYKYVLVEGGPTLLGSFLKDNLIDEIFLTIAPKIFGNGDKNTLTLVEGVLFPPLKTKTLQLISFKEIANELFLRYKLKS